jgi:hypothetical protein
MYTDQDIANLVARVQQLEQQAAARPPSVLPQYGILSKNFLTRAFSVWGLFFVSNLLIGIALSCVGVILGLLLGVTLTDWIQQLTGVIPTF